MNIKGKNSKVTGTEMKWSIFSKSVTIIIFVKFIDQLIDYPINYASLKLYLHIGKEYGPWSDSSWLACRVKISADDILIFFPGNRLWRFIQIVKPILETICIKRQRLSWGELKKKKRTIGNMLSTELA